MANKAVIGAAALGVSIYSISEYLKERDVERERDARHQLERDRLDTDLRRKAESKMKMGEEHFLKGEIHKS